MKSPILRLGITLLLASTFTLTAVAGEFYGVFKSADRGRSWTRSDAGLPGRSRINAFGSVGKVLFAGTDAGIFLSGDEAMSWGPAGDAAMTSGRVISFATLGPRVFAGTAGSGVLVSTDEGKSWIRNAGLGSKKVRCLVVHERRLYAGTDEDGVFVLGGGGEVWTQLREGLPAHAQIFALSGVQGRLFAGLYRQGLYGLDEKDGAWSKAGPVSPLALAVVGGTLVAGHNPGGLYWSADLGASWSKGTASEAESSTSPLAPDAGGLSSEAPVWELASDDGLVLAGASAGIYYSEDRGRTWDRARAGLPSESPGVSFLVKDAFILAGCQVRSADPR